MAYRPGKPNFEGAARGVVAGGFNSHQDHINRTLHDRIEKLEKHSQIQATDSDQQAPVTGKPPRANLKVVTALGSGRFRVYITNPEFHSPQNRGNQARSPLFHRLEVSALADFSRDVDVLPPTTQTYFELNHGSATLHFRLTSSYDGVNWNTATLSGPVIS